KLSALKKERVDLLLRQKQSSDHQTLPEEDMKRLLWLENIEIPDLQDKASAGGIGIAGPLLYLATSLAPIAILILFLRSFLKNKNAPNSAEAEENILNDMAHVIKDACKSAKPEIILPDTSGIKGRQL